MPRDCTHLLRAPQAPYPTAQPGVVAAPGRRPDGLHHPAPARAGGTRHPHQLAGPAAARRAVAATHQLVGAHQRPGAGGADRIRPAHQPQPRPGAQPGRAGPRHADHRPRGPAAHAGCAGQRQPGRDAPRDHARHHRPGRVAGGVGDRPVRRQPGHARCRHRTPGRGPGPVARGPRERGRRGGAAGEQPAHLPAAAGCGRARCPVTRGHRTPHARQPARRLHRARHRRPGQRQRGRGHGPRGPAAHAVRCGLQDPGGADRRARARPAQSDHHRPRAWL